MLIDAQRIEGRHFPRHAAGVLLPGLISARQRGCLTGD